jgi:DNA-binding CsgD family transcriptional regulator
MRTETESIGVGDAVSGLIAKLSPRQMEITALLADGKNAKQIATILSIGYETVKTHIRVACRKLDVDNRVQLIVMFAQWQVVNGSMDKLHQE